MYTYFFFFYFFFSSSFFSFFSSSPSSSLGAKLHSLNVLAFSTYNFHFLRSWIQLVRFFIFSFLMLFLMSSSHLFFGLPSGRVNIGFHLYTLFTILSSGIRCKWPNQLNLCAFMWFIIFLCLINSSNSFVLILHVLLHVISYVIFPSVLWSP